MMRLIDFKYDADEQLRLVPSGAHVVAPAPGSRGRGGVVATTLADKKDAKKDDKKDAKQVAVYCYSKFIRVS